MVRGPRSISRRMHHRRGVECACAKSSPLRPRASRDRPWRFSVLETCSPAGRAHGNLEQVRLGAIGVAQRDSLGTAAALFQGSFRALRGVQNMRILGDLGDILTRLRASFEAALAVGDWSKCAPTQAHAVSRLEKPIRVATLRLLQTVSLASRVKWIASATHGVGCCEVANRLDRRGASAQRELLFSRARGYASGCGSVGTRRAKRSVGYAHM